MNPVTFHLVALEHHRDLLREAEQQRRAHLAQQATARPPRQPAVVSLPTSSTPCPTC